MIMKIIAVVNNKGGVSKTRRPVGDNWGIKFENRGSKKVVIASKPLSDLVPLG